MGGDRPAPPPPSREGGCHGLVESCSEEEGGVRGVLPSRPSIAFASPLRLHRCTPEVGSWRNGEDTREETPEEAARTTRRSPGGVVGVETHDKDECEGEEDVTSGEEEAKSVGIAGVVVVLPFLKCALVPLLRVGPMEITGRKEEGGVVRNKDSGKGHPSAPMAIRVGIASPSSGEEGSE